MGISPQPRDLPARIKRLEDQIRILTSRVPSPPHLAVPLYQLWRPAGQTNTATAYSTAPASSAVGMGALWEGRIDQGSQPCLSVLGVWGDLDDADVTDVTITYQVKIGTITATWQATGQQTTRHLVDIRGISGQANLQVTLSVVDIGSAAGTDRLLCQPLGVHLRQVPTDGIFG